MALADVFGFESPFSPFDSGVSGSSPILAVRALLLVAVIVFGKRPAVVWGLGALFLAALAARIFVLPDLLASLAAVAVLAPRRVAIGGAVVTALGLGAAMLPPPPPPTSPSTIAGWRAEKNLWRARALALEAAKREKPPGDAYLELAQIDADLGLRTAARKVLEKVHEHGDDAARAKATALEQTWHD